MEGRDMTSKEKKENLDQNELGFLLKQLTTAGLYQGYVYFLTLLPQFTAGFVLLQNVFILRIVDSRCMLPECEEPLTQSPWMTMNKTVDLNLLLPLDDYIHEHCLRFPVDKNVTDICFAKNRNDRGV